MLDFGHDGEVPGDALGDQEAFQRHGLGGCDRQRRVHRGAERADRIVRRDGARVMLVDVRDAAWKPVAMHVDSLCRAGESHEEQADQRNPLRAPSHARRGRAVGAQTGSEEVSHAGFRAGGRMASLTGLDAGCYRKVLWGGALRMKDLS